MSKADAFLIETMYRACGRWAHGHIELITTSDGKVCMTLPLVGYEAIGTGDTMAEAFTDLARSLADILAMLGRREQTGAPNV